MGIGASDPCGKKTLPIHCAFESSSFAPARASISDKGSSKRRRTFGMKQEGLATLSAFRERLHEQLMNVPEYRALAVIDWTIQEVTQILGPAPMTERKIAPAI